MKLIDQHTKAIMEGCKERARDAGLSFEDESLEYIVSNKDLLKLSPKMMIPTLYDYWVHDVELIKGQKIYDVYPSNPYETVINTRPPISFYNDNNPDWLNVMIFYHVIGHIDFFQNNSYFSHTWDYDFTARALADKRHINNLRSKYGRQVDYIIEFSRSIDNLVGYHSNLSQRYSKGKENFSDRVNYYFDVFLQKELEVKTSTYMKEVTSFNQKLKDSQLGEDDFFVDVEQRYPEFPALFEKHKESNENEEHQDLIQYLLNNSTYLNKDKNKWMKTILEVIRSTSIYFQPQIRTKIMNEGWASYWHEKLFLQDDRIEGHEVQFAKSHAKVTSLPRVGLNPYAIGLRLFKYIEEKSNKGKFSYEFEKLKDSEQRDNYDQQKSSGLETILNVREEFCDFTFLNNFIDQEFVTKNKLFVTGRRLNQSKMTWEYYIKSKKYQDYLKMMNESLYHPPNIEIAPDKGKDGSLYLNHAFEGKPLVQDYIKNTLFGISYLWGDTVQLETSEVESIPPMEGPDDEIDETDIEWKRVVYKMEEKELTKEAIQ